jgi:hypothetical protein
LQVARLQIANCFLWQSFCIFFDQTSIMNLKRVFGIILTILGIVGLIYAATVFMNGGSGSRQIKSLIVYGALGAIFFFTGIGLIKGTRDDARPPVQ